MRILLVGVSAVLFSMAGCDSVDVKPDTNLIVVEAFLYAGEPEVDVRLTYTVPLTSEDSVATPINDAQVALAKADAIYDLTPTGTGGHYEYRGRGLRVEAGDEFTIEIRAGGQMVRATTLVPEAPEAVAISHDELELPALGLGGPMGGGRLDNYVTVTWDNPTRDLHFVVIESRIEGEPDYILPEFIRERFDRFRLVNRPTDANYHDINIRSLEVLGAHEARVYRVNKEYADLYENRQQDSRDLNEPPTNVVGGLGVFSAFNGVGVEFAVVRP